MLRLTSKFLCQTYGFRNRTEKQRKPFTMKNENKQLVNLLTRQFVN